MLFTQVPSYFDIMQHLYSNSCFQTAHLNAAPSSIFTCFDAGVLLCIPEAEATHYRPGKPQQERRSVLNLKAARMLKEALMSHNYPFQ